MREPLILPFAALAAGVLVSRYLPFGLPDFLLGVGCGLALGILALWRGSRRAAGACCLLGLFCAGGWIETLNQPGRPPEIEASAREIVILGGCVVEPPAVAGERERFLLELEPGARVQVTLYTKEGETLPTLHYGQRVDVETRLRKPHSFGNPGAFDFAAYLARRDIYWTASAPASSVKLLDGRCGSRFQAAVMALRVAALERLAAIYRGDDYATGMMQAVLLGETFQMQRVWTENYRATGTFHVIVISGTHVAILAAFLLLVLRLCGVPEEWATPATALSAWLYALVTGWQSPCVRSAAGFTLYTIGRMFYRKGRGLNVLAAVAIGFVLLDPDQIFDPSFQLTFLAVGFIGAFAAPLLAATAAPARRAITDLADSARDLHLAPRVAQLRIELRLLAQTLELTLKLPRRLAHLGLTAPARVFLFVYEITLVSVVVQLGLALPMVVYFHRIGASGLSANAVVVPLMGLVVPIGFIAIFTGWAWVGKIGGMLLWLSRIAVDWHARMEPNWRIPTPPLWLAVAVTAALIAVAALRGRWRWGATAATFALLALLIAHPFPAQVTPGELELTVVDVGQGDGLLVAFPDRKLMLVDGGGIPTFGPGPKSKMDIGEDVIAPYLWSRSIRKVDVVVMSHAHDDHIGGLPALVNDFHPRELWTGAAPSSPAWDALRAQAVAAGVRIVPLTSPREIAFGGATVKVLAPSPDYEPEGDPKNNYSLVLRVQFGKHSFLLSGDAEKQVEWRMLDDNGLGLIDVLKVGHHGSRTSSTEEFIASVQPLFAVISVGLDNSYGHPHPTVMERFEQHHITVWRTDRDGLVTFHSNGKRLRIETGRDLSTAGPQLLNAF